MGEIVEQVLTGCQVTGADFILTGPWRLRDDYLSLWVRGLS
jgi:hypothetical protein